MDIAELISQINRADERQIDDLLEAVFVRKRELYPQWDILYLALPKQEWEERKRILEMILEIESRFQEEYQEN